MMTPAPAAAPVVALAAAAVLALALLLAPRAPDALDELRLTLQSVEGDGWSSGPLTVTLGLGRDDRLSLHARAEALALPAPLDGVRRAELRCPGALWQDRRIACDDAVLELSRADGELLHLRARTLWEGARGRFSLRLADQALAGGTLDLDLVLAPDGLRIASEFAGLELASLMQFAALLGAAPPVSISDGKVSGTLTLRQAGAAGDASARIAFDGAGYSDAEGLRVGESLSGSVSLDGDRREGNWRLQVNGELSAGLVYEDPLLLEFGGEPLTVALALRQYSGGRLDVESFDVVDPRGVRLAGSARVDLTAVAPLRALELEVERVAAARVYQRYLKSFTGVGALSNLDLQGGLSARLDWREDAPARATLMLHELAFGDAEGRFALFGLDGEIHWAAAVDPPASRLAWSGAQVYAVHIGAGAARLSLAGRSLTLLEPVSVPVLDGAVQIERLVAIALGTPAQRVDADLAVAPLSLERLSDRLAWLPLAGSVSGRFPQLEYTERRLAVNGDVQMRLFDGDVTISGLTLEEPFGVVPRLRADMAIRDIDLELLTRAFSFGSIEGRLEGQVSGLVLEGWQPLAFDAVLLTPEDDDSRHRISQRAVDNLASLGGANAVLSSTFLRFFEEFSYERLGLSCRLRAGICEMGGVENAPRGYYIVKGGGLPPRVDVVGFNSRVDWRTLLERLKAVAGSQGPVVR